MAQPIVPPLTIVAIGVGATLPANLIATISGRLAGQYSDRAHVARGVSSLATALRFG